MQYVLCVACGVADSFVLPVMPFSAWICWIFFSGWHAAAYMVSFTYTSMCACTKDFINKGIWWKRGDTPKFLSEASTYFN